VPETDPSASGDPGEPAEDAGGGEPGWEDQQTGGGDDGWETSNQLPGAETADIPPMPSERGPAGSSEGAEGDGGGDAALDEALKDFDGEILAEREVIRARANETAGGGTEPEPGSSGSEGAAPDAGQIPGAPAGGTAGATRGGPMGVPGNRNTPPPPGPAVAGADVPDDIPDAKDDDIIARQLREAAMQETDPELKEKLWDEYRRYKGSGATDPES
jgi:hypothetical protein